MNLLGYMRYFRGFSAKICGDQFFIYLYYFNANLGMNVGVRSCGGLGMRKKLRNYQHETINLDRDSRINC
jgi:hypothetical protein